MQDPILVLRDIHQVNAPAWWPPAPGWWGLAAVFVTLVLACGWWQRRKRIRRRRVEALFDAAVAISEPPVAQVAAMSELLRRCARLRDPQADRLQGEAWLAFLEGAGLEGAGRAGVDMPQAFTQGAGRLLLDGGFRREADPREVAALRALVRQRFLAWMTR